MLTDARFDFTFEILEKIICLQKSNVFFSPYIIYNTLCLAYYDCCDTLEKTLKRILHIPDQLSKDDVEKSLARERVDRACEEINESCTSKIANRMWIIEKKLSNSTYKLFPFNYQWEIAILHTNPADVERTINKWVLDVTGNIPDMLPQDSVSENDNLVLASAVRFKDVWDKSRFNPDIGALSKLILSRLSIDTQSMPSNTCVQIKSTKLNAYIMEKPFLYGDVSIFKLIPVSSNTNSPQTENLFSNPKINEIMRLVRCLKTEEGSRELRRLMDEGIAAQEGMRKKKFQWFWIEERDIAMSQLLHTLGAGELLTSGTMNLPDSMRDGKQSLYRLSDAVHRAKIMTDREGTYATASTAIGSFCCNSVPVFKNPDFNVKTPFLFLIYDKRRSNILFAGILIEDAKTLQMPVLPR